MAASGSPTAVPEGFHFETKYVILSYLGLPPPSQGQPTQTTGSRAKGSAQESEKERSSRIKTEIEEELKQLEEEVSTSFATTGFDHHTSPVFSPANPECSVEDSLALLGDRLARELDSHLASAVNALLSRPVSYEPFQAAALAVCPHTQGGWSKVLVPLLLLQGLQEGGQPLSSLLPIGMRYLEEEEADFIIQQGGWGTVISLEEVADPGVIIAEDSNDIYILSGEQAPERASPPASLLTVGDSSGPGSWQTESLPVSLTGHESWAQVTMTDPEDAKSLDSAEGVALAEERSENNSSNSDIVHVEREDAELLDEGGETVEEAELQESVLSVLGTESDLAAVRTELREQSPSPPETVPAEPEPPVGLEEQDVTTETSVSLSAEPSLVVVEPEAVATLPTAGPVPSEPPAPEPEPEPELVSPPAPEEPRPESPVKEPPAAPAPEPEPEPQPEPQPQAQMEPLLEKQPESVTVPPLQELPPEEPTSKTVPEPYPPAPQPEPEPEPESSELPILLYGGAALVAIAAVLAYGALSYRKK